MIFALIGALDTGTRRRMLTGGIIASILAVSLVVSVGFMAGILPGALWDGTGTHTGLRPLYTIDSTVANEFAAFVPYDENFTVNAPLYSIAPGLVNVANLGHFTYLSSEERDLIQRHGFVANRQSTYEQIYEILSENEQANTPSFISVDAVLHAFHVLYDLALREAEAWSFWDLLGNLTASMLESSYQQYLTASEGRWREAALRNTMFFSVVLTLLDNDTVLLPEVEQEVNTVLDLIEEHAGISNNWFQGYWEDWSQYVPRGHYTRSDLFERYFKAMMFYGRVMFRLQPFGSGVDNEVGRNETAQSILVSLALTEQVSGLPAQLSGYDVWDAIYEPTAFFVGVADDLLPTEYLSIIEDIYGTSTLDLEDLNNDILLDLFIEEALNLRDPTILSSIINDTETIDVTKGLRFMGQRFVPDSFMLGQLVYTYVGTQDLPRLMPKGLDVMAALGSERAWQLLEDQRIYANYESQMDMLCGFVDNMTAEQWTQNLYWLWLYSLLPLLEDSGQGYPFFMQNEAWTDKQLMTALGSWTELRHDTILYAKQSYTVDITSIPPLTVGYVEPAPQVYGRLASLCKMMIDGLSSRSLLSQAIQDRLDRLHSYLLSLRAISLKELSGQALNDTEAQLVMYSGGILSYIGSIPSEDSELLSDADKIMALIADVHTDPNEGQVLEEAVGNPMVIYVAVPVVVSAGVQIVLTRGGTFSYYEFAQHMDNRLTDEAWQAMLDGSEEPGMPSWTASFVIYWSAAGLGLLETAPFRRE